MNDIQVFINQELGQAHDLVLAPHPGSNGDPFFSPGQALAPINVPEAQSSLLQPAEYDYSSSASQVLVRPLLDSFIQTQEKTLDEYLKQIPEAEKRLENLYNCVQAGASSLSPNLEQARNEASEVHERVRYTSTQSEIAAILLVNGPIPMICGHEIYPRYLEAFMLGRKHGYSESKVREMINHVFDFALRPPGTPNPLPSDPPSYALVQATLRANEALQNRTGVNIRRSFTPITPRQSLLTQVSEFLERFVRIGSTAISGIVPDPNESLG